MIKVVCGGTWSRWPKYLSGSWAAGPKCGASRSLFSSLEKCPSVTPPRSDQASGSRAAKLNQWFVSLCFSIIKSVNQKGTFAVCRSATVNNYGWLISIRLHRGVLSYVVRSLQKENKSRMMFFFLRLKAGETSVTFLYRHRSGKHIVAPYFHKAASDMIHNNHLLMFYRSVRRHL